MKRFTFILVGLIAVSFLQLHAQSSDSETLQKFLKDIPAFNNENASALGTIQIVNDLAVQKAAKTISFSGENIKDALGEAKQYKYCIIIVEAHTIVKVSDFEKCSQSGSWGTCMPYGEGYIRKGGLTGINDYINNIIGKPDSQSRMMYLFN